MDKNCLLANHAVYQIYPLSFCDGNGDGIGDIPGIISKLDYLEYIGIKIIWISPLYDSPMKDNGYDVADYYSINPRFGTMEDFDRLMEEANKRGMKIVMDLVVNHTSDQCRWFQEALKDPTSPYRDYYIFKKGKAPGKKPNNWQSFFLGSAWESVPGEEDMYYLHLFSKQQPDLNWHNPKVLEEVEKIIAFWMDKGVYGFRCDVISHIYKNSFEDGKARPIGTPRGVEHYTATKGNHEILKRIRKDVIEPHHGVLIGECSEATVENIQDFLHGDELDTFFSFEHVNYNAGAWSNKTADPKKLKTILKKWQENVDCNGNYFENHDQHRVIWKYIKKGYEDVGSKMMLTLLFALRGTPFIYMGQEFGSRNYPETLPIEECDDVVTHFIYDLARKWHVPKKLALAKANHNGRDHERAPIAWNGKEGYGFTEPGVKPWMKFNPEGAKVNAEDAWNDPNSILNYFKKVNLYREQSDVLNYGSIRFLDAPSDVMHFIREYEGQKLEVCINLSHKMRDVKEDNGTLEITNYPNDHVGLLRPYEAKIRKL